MKTDDAGDYGGSCDTCAQGQAKPGHRQCPACERRAAEEQDETPEELDEEEAGYGHGV